MLKNYLAIAIRNIRQNPFYAVINIFSLAIGLAAVLVIYLFISDEKSFDSFNSKSERIYRVDEVQSFSGTNTQKVALSMPGMGPHMLEDFPEVDSYTRFWNWNKRVIEKGQNRFLIKNIAAVDSTFLDVFDYELLSGDRATALMEPNCILLTEETAEKFFPTASDALGNTLTVDTIEVRVTGVLKNVPENSHLQFNALISVRTRWRGRTAMNDSWGSNFLNTYLLLKPGTDYKALAEKFDEFMVRHTGNEDIGDFYKVYLQPLKDVHLGSMDIEHDYNNYRKFNGEYLSVFTIVAVFILLIAGVNFMNLTTARASHRWKEIGVRKTVGAKKTQLFLQFIVESIFLAMIALVLALVLDVALVPILNTLIGRQLSLVPFFTDLYHMSVFLLIAIGLGILTGIYPSFYMTSFNMARVLKGGNKSEGRSIFRSGLVIVQFGLALAMIVSTFVVLQQLYFMKNKDIGFSKDQMLLVDMSQEANDQFQVLKTELKKSKYVLGVTASGQRIGNNFHQWGFKVKGDTGVVTMTPSNVVVDYDYLDVYGIKVKEGRSFSSGNPRDNGFAFIINEKLANDLGLKNPVGTPAGHSWYENDSLGSIIGVVEDFNFNSLHYAVNTLEICVHTDWGFGEMSVKLDGNNIQEGIADVKEVWSKLIPSHPFDYSFLDEHFEELYRSDQQMSFVVSIMASLAILISCMGLFGLVAITTERRTKEIGIRKVLGASETQITFLLSSNFALLILVSFILASPITYWLLEEWLQEFAFRIEINLLWFVLGGLLAILVALITISYHTIRSARANPVDTLRYE